MNPMSSYQGWHSPLASSLPYISSVDSSPERGVILSMGMSPLPYDDNDDNELQYRLDEEIASSTEHIKTDRSTSSDDGSDQDIDEIQRAIDKTLGFSDKDDDDTPRNINPRSKYLQQLGIGKKTSQQPTPVPPITRKLPLPSQSTPRDTSRTPPTSPVSDTDDSLDAMLALMGVSDQMTTHRVIRSSPIDIPRKMSRPIPVPIPSRRSRPAPRPVVPIMQQQQHKYDSDDDTESYFDSPQSEDLSGSMLFDY